MFRDFGAEHQVACHFAEEMNTVGGEVKAAIGLDISEPGADALPPASEPAIADPSQVAPT